MVDRVSKNTYIIDVQDGNSRQVIKGVTNEIKKKNAAVKEGIVVDKKANAAQEKADAQVKKSATKISYLNDKYNMHSSQVKTLIKQKKAEEQAWVKANYRMASYKTTSGETVYEVQKMTAAQKLSTGMWSSSFPVLDKANKFLNSLRWSMVNVTFGLLALGAIASPFVLLTKQGMEWEQQLKRINVIAGVTTDQLSSLTDFIKQTRQGTSFTRMEVSDSMLEFMKAGFSLNETKSAISDIIDLAAAGFTDLATATDIVAASMHQFAVEGVTTAEVVSVIAKAANESAADVDTFGNSMSYVGPIAAQLGFSFKETAAALTILFNAGLAGSRAGTTLRQVLNSLSGPSVEAKKWMDDLGISLYNVDGSARDLNSVLLSIKVGLDKLNTEDQARAMADMFSIRSRAGVAAFKNALDEAVNSMAKIESGLNDINYASDRAQIALDTNIVGLKDAVENLKDAMLPIGESISNSLAGIIDALARGTARLTGTDLDRRGLPPGVPEEILLTRSDGSKYYINQITGETRAYIDLKESADSVVPAVNRLANAQTQLNTLIRDFEKNIESVTPISDNLYASIFEAESGLSMFEKFMSAIKEIRPNDWIGVSVGFGAGIKAQINSIKESETKIVDWTAANKELSISISENKFLLDDLSETLSYYKDALSDVNKEISVLSNKRFTMETPFDAVIQKQEQVIRMQELAAMGITDVQAFIASAINRTGDSYDGVVDSIERVTSATDLSKNAFKAWQQTVQEHIRTLIGESVDLARDTTDAVQAHMTLLLSTSATSQVTSGKTASELQLEKLKLAQDAYFGNMHEQVGLAIQGDEDRVNGVASGSDVIISALQSEWEKRDLLNVQIEDAQVKYDAQAEVLARLQKEHEANALAIQKETAAMQEQIGVLNAWVASQARGVNMINSNSDYVSRGGGGSVGSSYTTSRGVKTTVAYSGTSPLTGKSVQISAPHKSSYGFGDFIMRPGQAPIGFSENDTIVGVKDLSSLQGNSVTIGSININGVSGDVNEFARRIALEIRREIDSGS